VSSATSIITSERCRLTCSRGWDLCLRASSGVAPVPVCLFACLSFCRLFPPTRLPVCLPVCLSALHRSSCMTTVTLLCCCLFLVLCHPMADKASVHMHVAYNACASCHKTAAASYTSCAAVRSCWVDILYWCWQVFYIQISSVSDDHIQICAASLQQ
jgi:hypothetical protein